MCLGIPGEVVEVVDPVAHLATVAVSGVKRTVSLALLADEPVGVGDWVLVHVGFAMGVIDAEEAAQTLAAMRHLGTVFTDEVAAFEGSVVA